MSYSISRCTDVSSLKIKCCAQLITCFHIYSNITCYYSTLSYKSWILFPIAKKKQLLLSYVYYWSDCLCSTMSILKSVFIYSSFISALPIKPTEPIPDTSVFVGMFVRVIWYTLVFKLDICLLFIQMRSIWFTFAHLLLNRRCQSSIIHSFVVSKSRWRHHEICPLTLSTKYSWFCSFVNTSLTKSNALFATSVMYTITSF